MTWHLNTKDCHKSQHFLLQKILQVIVKKISRSRNIIFSPDVTYIIHILNFSVKLNHANIIIGQYQTAFENKQKGSTRYQPTINVKLINYMSTTTI